jgi:hypothetical protein
MADMCLPAVVQLRAPLYQRKIAQRCRRKCYHINNGCIILQPQYQFSLGYEGCLMTILSVEMLCYQETDAENFYDLFVSIKRWR